MRFSIGLDLGQINDYTAIAIIETLDSEGGHDMFHLRHLERMRISYPDVAIRVKTLMESEQLKDKSTLVVDATGVGLPVVEMLVRSGVYYTVPIIITGGTNENYENGIHYVPKRNLVSLTQIMFQEGRLKIAKMPDTPTLVEELVNFKVKITDNAHDTYGGWREGIHDDLVLAVALALWDANRPESVIFLV